MKNISIVSDKAIFFARSSIEIEKINSLIEKFLNRRIKVFMVMLDDSIEKMFNSYVNSFDNFIEWKKEVFLIYPDSYWKENEIYFLANSGNTLFKNEYFIDFIKKARDNENFLFKNESSSIKGKIIESIINDKKILKFEKKVFLMDSPFSFVQKKKKEFLEKKGFYILCRTGIEKDVLFFKENIFFEYGKRIFYAEINE